MRKLSVHAKIIAELRSAATPTRADLRTFTPTMAVPRHQDFSSQRITSHPVEGSLGIDGSPITLVPSCMTMRCLEQSAIITSFTDILLEFMVHFQMLSTKLTLSKRMLHISMPLLALTHYTRTEQQKTRCIRCGLGPTTSDRARSLLTVR